MKSKRLHLITSPNNKRTKTLLCEASAVRGVEVVVHDVMERDVVSQAKPERGEMLYRTSSWDEAKSLHNVFFRMGVVSFYSDFSRAFLIIPRQSLYLEKHGLPIVTTVHYLPKKRHEIAQAVDRLGGFPIIIKALGGSHGVGVMRVDSMAALKSTVDYLATVDDVFELRRFVKTDSTARLIVLGERVVSSIEYITAEGEFRSNSEGMRVEPRKFDESVEDVAIAAVKAYGVEFGGVDVIFDEVLGPCVLEVNFPCFFPRCQDLTGDDVAGQMVEYLMEKSKRMVG